MNNINSYALMTWGTKLYAGTLNSTTGGEVWVYDLRFPSILEIYKRQAINTKEDLEVLNGLTQGNHAWEELHVLRCIKQAKFNEMI